MILDVNGQKREVAVSADRSLLEVLREKLDLTGSKYGCGEGVCGACTVIVNGKAARSCVVPVGSAQGKAITTIEGLKQNNRLHAVQEAFLQTDPFQCSYCASGMIMSAFALLNKNANPTDDEIVNAMNGNICRCGTYPDIIKAIKLAIKS